MREKDLHRLSTVQLHRNSHDFIVMYYLLKDLKDAIHEYARGKLFDIGCGNKPYEIYTENFVTQYIGSDVIQSSLHKVDIICEATNILTESNAYDTVLSTQVMEHVGHPDKMLQEANRILKDNGHLIISIPFCWELHEEPYDFFRYSKYGLKEMFERNGFEVVYIKANGGKWAAIFQLNINMIYSTFKKKNFFIKIVKVIFLHLKFTALINFIAIWLDKKWHHELLTLNYVAVARKKAI